MHCKLRWHLEINGQSSHTFFSAMGRRLGLLPCLNGGLGYLVMYLIALRWKKRGKVSLSICVGLAPRRWGCGGGVKPSRVGKDGPTHPPLKQNGHHCDNLISDVRHRHVNSNIFEIKNSANSVPEQPEYLYLCRTVDTAQVCKTVLGLHKQLQFEPKHQPKSSVTGTHARKRRARVKRGDAYIYAFNTTQ